MPHISCSSESDGLIVSFLQQILRIVRATLVQICSLWMMPNGASYLVATCARGGGQATFYEARLTNREIRKLQVARRPAST